MKQQPTLQQSKYNILVSFSTKIPFLKRGKNFKNPSLKGDKIPRHIAQCFWKKGNKNQRAIFKCSSRYLVITLTCSPFLIGRVANNTCSPLRMRKWEFGPQDWLSKLCKPQMPRPTFSGLNEVLLKSILSSFENEKTLHVFNECRWFNRSIAEYNSASFSLSYKMEHSLKTYKSELTAY